MLELGAPPNTDFGAAALPPKVLEFAFPVDAAPPNTLVALVL